MGRGGAVDALCGAGWGTAQRKIGVGATQDGAQRRGKAGGGERRIVTIASRCAVDAARQADDAMKVAVVASEENIWEWKNGRCLLHPIDMQT